MKIEYLGHSCFRLTESGGASIVCDPYSDAVGFKMPKSFADAVSISHHHFDHDAVENVQGEPKILDSEGGHKLDGVEMQAIKSFHDECHGKKRGENLIFKFRMDGIDICHFGDLGEACSPDLIKKLLPVNVLLIPVGGNYTIDAKTAKEYVEKIGPDVVIPMHYRTQDSKIDIGTLDKFLELFDRDCIEEADGSAIELSVDHLTGKTRIIVLRKK